eukprot:COSAG01_NODE_272_length_19747_cov_298.524023_14_plen_297_part_00
MHRACMHGQQRVVELLLRGGAKQLRNHAGLTPLDIALSKQRQNPTARSSDSADGAALALVMDGLQQLSLVGPSASGVGVSVGVGVGVGGVGGGGGVGGVGRGATTSTGAGGAGMASIPEDGLAHSATLLSHANREGRHVKMAADAKRGGGQDRHSPGLYVPVRSGCALGCMDGWLRRWQRQVVAAALSPLSAGVASLSCVGVRTRTRSCCRRSCSWRPQTGTPCSTPHTAGARSAQSRASSTPRSSTSCSGMRARCCSDGSALTTSPPPPPPTYLSPRSPWSRVCVTDLGAVAELT